MALVVVFASLFCLAPLSAYLFHLSILARRDRPTVVSGSWDFAVLTLGLSGFYLFGGGLVLTLLQSNFRYWMRGNLEAFRGAWASDSTTWVLISSVYVLGVIAMVGLTLVSRRHSLVVYNVEPTEFESAISDVFERLNRPVERRGKVWVAGVPLFELDTFEGGRTVTLRWVSDDHALFHEVERLVRESMKNVATDDNPAAAWLLSCAGGTGFWAAGSFALILVYFFS